MPFSLAIPDEIKLPFAPGEFAPTPGGALGPALRAAREASQRSIEEMAQATRIGAHYLAALEETRLDDFSGRVYAVGFARSYAAALGLPTDWAQDRMREAIDAQNPSWRRRGWNV